MKVYLVWALCAIAVKASAENPFLPLTEPEIATAVDVLKRSGQIGADALFPYIVLEEPAKAKLKDPSAIRRVAWVNVWDNKTRITEWRVDLAGRVILSSTSVSQGQAPILPHEYTDLPALVRKDPRWQKAILSRGIKNFDDVMMDIWATGPFNDPEHQDHRMAKAVPYLKAGFTNAYAHPIEVITLIDVSLGKIVEVRDSGIMNVGRQMDDFDAEAVKKEPSVLAAPLALSTPSFRLDSQEVSWQGWKFRYALHPREGLVLYTVSHRGRSILHRAALSEMVVPYADPDRNWMWRNAFDVGEYGVGRMTSPHKPGQDAPAHALLLDADIADEYGRALRIPRAVAIFERDGGVLWRHQDVLADRTDSRRASELVIQCIATVSNYDYIVSWVFRQDGSIIFEADLTGIMLAKSMDPGHEAHAGHIAHAVAKNIYAVHHQHFFNVRLDFDVDGERNSVAELSTTPEPPGPNNPYGNAMAVTETVLAAEKAAARDVDFRTQRKWKIIQPAKRNALGQPTGYALIPGESSLTFLAADSPVRRKAGFIDHQFWTTRLHPEERYAAGDYPNQGAAGEGLPRFVADDEPLVNEDVVAWYTFGVTHIPRPEEWPVMPVHRTGFKIVPVGFYSRNPAMGPISAAEGR